MSVGGLSAYYAFRKKAGGLFLEREAAWPDRTATMIDDTRWEIIT
jgi:hypothetical protein